MNEFVSVVLNDQTGTGQRRVATVVLSRPPINTMTRHVYREIGAAAVEVGRRDDIAAVILFGGHEIFSAGDDVSALRMLTASEAQTAARARGEAAEALAAIPKPTVAAITGYALGAGLALALAADWRISGDNAKFGATEILAGLIPDGMTMMRLARTVGVSKAKDLVYSGRFFGAEEALALGLIDQLVAPDDVYDRAAAWARRFLDGSPLALATAKRAIDAPGEQRSPEQLAAEHRRYGELFAAGATSVDRCAPGPPAGSLG